jgi:hypothetical protein
VLDALTGLPAIVLNGHTDLVAANTLGRRAARRPYDQALAALIGELSTRSDEFRIRRARHGVRTQTTEPGSASADGLRLLAGWAAGPSVRS